MAHKHGLRHSARRACVMAAAAALTACGPAALPTAAAGSAAEKEKRNPVPAEADSIEVAHEALLREWPRLHRWLDDDVQGRQVRQHLSQTARTWDTRGRDASDASARIARRC